MWIGEQLAKSVQVSEFFFFGSFLSQCWLTVSLHWVHLCHGHERLDKTQLFDSCVSFSSRVSKKIFHPFFFFPPSYTQLMHMIQDCLPVRCEQFIFLDVPKVFSASWKLVSTSLKPSFKKIMAISNRQGEKVVLSFSNVDDVVRLCGALHWQGQSSSWFGWKLCCPKHQCLCSANGEKKRERERMSSQKSFPRVRKRRKSKSSLLLLPTNSQNWLRFQVSARNGRFLVLIFCSDDALSNDGASVPGVYALKIRSRTNSRTNSVSNLAALTKEKEKDKTLISKNSSKLSFFGRKKE